jgi:predicted acetyltransferase
MNIAEWVYLNREAMEGMLAFIANHDSMAATVRLQVAAGDRLPFLLPDPRFKQERTPHCMGRIVDVQGFAAAYAFRPGEGETRVALRITDACAPWNDGSFVLTVDRSGRGKLEPAAADRPADACACACDIRALTAMMLGYARPTALHEDGLLAGDSEAVAQLEACIPAVRPNLIDYF